MRKKSCCVRVFSFVFLTALFLLPGVAAMAQSTSSLQGTVTDEKGGVVPNATIVVRSQATAIERTTHTDEAGNYQVAALPAGFYHVEVRAQGFGTQIVESLNLEVAHTAIKDFQLKVGDINQQVTVTADTSIIESATTSVGTVINQRTVQEIPLNGRH